MRSPMLKNYLPLVVNTRNSVRTPSIPFISGDTFRYWSDFSIEPGGKETHISLLPTIGRESTIFVKVDIFHNKSTLKSFYRYLEQYEFEPGKGPKLLIHNGDFPPSDSVIDQLAVRGATIYCVNKIEESEYLKALPIGLENAHFNKSGVINDFLHNGLPVRETSVSVNKINMIFTSFSANTNELERLPLIDAIKRSRHKFSGSGLTMTQYLQELSSSRFVLSPKGNGLDCHRTWESIYLGAIPVVLEGTLANSFTSSLPIWEISNWEQVLGASDEELLDRYKQLSRRNAEMAFSDFWEKRLFGSIRA